MGADLSVPTGASTLAEKVRAAAGERLDVLVLNAGISKAAPLADYTTANLDELFATNVRAPFFLVQQLVPLLGEGSNIVVVTSAVARTVIGKPALENPSILGKELGRDARAERHTRECGRPGHYRHRYVELH
jgi:NAD(P)-dependent dehydrogenase (short-subunit alcohol dehydrogenase family)